MIVYNLEHMHLIAILNYENDENLITCKSMDRTRDHYAK